MKYVVTYWADSVDWLPDWPDKCTVELDSDNFEVRRVETFRDGRLAFTDGDTGTPGTVLADVAYPDFSEIQGFKPRLITKAEFETLWNEAIQANSGT